MDRTQHWSGELSLQVDAFGSCVQARVILDSLSTTSMAGSNLLHAWKGELEQYGTEPVVRERRGILGGVGGAAGATEWI